MGWGTSRWGSWSKTYSSFSFPSPLGSLCPTKLEIKINTSLLKCFLTKWYNNNNSNNNNNNNNNNRNAISRNKRNIREKKKNALYLSVNVFSTKVLIGDTILTSPTGDGTAILRGHPSHAKVQSPAGQRKYLHFSVILRPWVLVRPRESNPRPPALQSSALPTELILPRSEISTIAR